ncbi:MAG: hypothetical protein J6U80_04890 [Bacteroidales bacterium]|nr:hypothetical protein [Bacteroidales bacterium]
MKFRNIIMAVIALVITASGCQKIDSAETNSTVKVKFTIADKPVLGDPGQTKAVKTAWAEGDAICFAFMDNNFDIIKIISKSTPFQPNIFYEDGKWSELTIPNEYLTALGSEGIFIAIHHRKGTTYAKEITLGNVTSTTINGESYDKICSISRYSGGEIMFAADTYTVSDGVMDLGNINMALDPRLFQISIYDELFTNEEGNIYLSEGTIAGTGATIDPTIYNGLSIYKNKEDWTDPLNPTESNLFTYYTPLVRGGLYLDFDFNSTTPFVADKSKTFAQAVINPIGEDIEDYDLSYCFLDTRTHLVIPPDSYTFWIDRFEGGGVTFETWKKVFYKTYAFNSSTTNLVKGKAYRLGTTGWDSK